MSNPIIRVENLSKKYIVNHRQEGYTTFRDAMTNGARSLTQALFNRKNPNPFNSADEEFWALKDVNFDIQQGDRVGIIGRNGAGKSTLLKVLSRITEPTSGSIRIKGRVASLLEVGTGFHPELTGRENVFLNGAILGMSKAEIKRKFDEIVAFAEVERFLDTPVKRYSSGMYVRLAFAVAAHMEPEILIVDEVLAVGDVQFQKKCLGKMGQVASEGRTVFFVSHQMGAISSLCDKVIYLKGGEVEASGKTEDIIKLYFSEVLQNKIEDLNQLRVSGFGKQTKFTDIQLVAQEKTLKFGQPIQYELTLVSDVERQGLSIGSSFFNSSGACVGTLITDDFSIAADQPLTLQLTVASMNLAPDSYHAGFSIGFGQAEGTRKDLDIVIGKPAFEILPMSEDTSYMANWHPNWGNIAFTDVRLTRIGDRSPSIL
jgi:lipopolysaccharide transport system ATP-binding protein